MKKRHQEEDAKKDSSNKDSTKDKPKAKDDTSGNRRQIVAAAVNVDMDKIRQAIQEPSLFSSIDVEDAFLQGEYDSATVSYVSSLTGNSTHRV